MKILSLQNNTSKPAFSASLSTDSGMWTGLKRSHAVNKALRTISNKQKDAIVSVEELNRTMPDYCDEFPIYSATIKKVGKGNRSVLLARQSEGSFSDFLILMAKKIKAIKLD